MIDDCRLAIHICDNRYVDMTNKSWDYITGRSWRLVSSWFYNNLYYFWPSNFYLIRSSNIFYYIHILLSVLKVIKNIMYHWELLIVNSVIWQNNSILRWLFDRYVFNLKKNNNLIKLILINFSVFVVQME